MDRREAMLRELNLYPQWVLREGGVAGSGYPAASPSRGLRVAPAATEVSPSSTETNRELVQAEAEVQAASVTGKTEKAVAGLTGESRPPAVSPPSVKAKDELSGLAWPELKQQVQACTACKLRAGCKQTVFGVGDERADWLFVGEGPGADEDALGEPFVGQAGKLLDNMLMAIKLKRGNNAYIANIVKCRPPDNRTPAADEIAQCLPYLQRQIELVRPKLIVALGKVASNGLLGKDATIASLRGKLHDYRGIPLIVTYHPAYLLRSPSEKAKAWQDLCLAVRFLADTGA